MNERRTVLFRGRVQGVGFRWTTRRIAARYPVTGYVMNLSDGRVELVVEAPTPDIGEFLAAIRERFDGHIEDEEAATAPATGEFTCFDIRHVRM